MFTRPPFLFFQHHQQCDTLLPIVPCTHKLKAGIAYSDTEPCYLENCSKHEALGRCSVTG